MSATPRLSQVYSPNSSKGQNSATETQLGESVQPLQSSIPPLLGASLTDLTQWVQQQEQPAYRGRQLHEWIYQKGARSLSEISVFSKQWRGVVADVPIVGS